MIYTYNGILLSYQKNEILPFVMMWMELECIILSKISQSEKDKYYMISLIWNLRNKTGEHNVRRVKKEKIGKQTTRDSSFLQESSGRGGQKDGGRETNRERI